MPDRNSVRARIKRAVSDGRISAADGEIRLRNVDAAQSETELDLIARDLDQLEVAVAPAGAYPSPAPGPGAAARGSRRSVWVAAGLAVVLGAVVLGAAGLFVFSGGSEVHSGSGLGEPSTIGVEPSQTAGQTAGASPTVPTPAAPAYSLSAAGIRSFIATYRQRFGTARAVQATFYGDYVVVQVPAGKHRHTGWLYREASGFTDFGGMQADFPGSVAVDLSRLDRAALVRNIARARRVLHVADISQVYVTIDYRPQFDQAANVNIYVTNAVNESGYLATRMNGTIERSYPFGGQ